tara:strand:+ start:3953 stop:5047 length:1095 start_codon:yes stop_codon:yes gene_type:complete
MIKKKILIATGGTGGHIFPAYSLVNFFEDKYHSVALTTDYRGFKYLKDYKNLNISVLPSSPLIKKNFIKILFSILKVFYSIIRSFLFLLFNRPSIIFGMGGYSSFPICIAASILRIKFIIYENNLVLGKANKLLLPYAKKIFVSYKELDGIPEKYKYKVFELGNLIRKEIIDKSLKNNHIEKIGGLKILVIGGSQAAKIFANDLPLIFNKLKNSNIEIKVFQQCQKEQNKELSEFYGKTKIDYELFNFSNNIIKYYSKVNLVITRSGASVLAELLNFNIPFISIPLPTSADNHQYKNAEFYSKKGYGYLLEEKDIKIKLFDLINLIYKDTSLIKKIKINQSQYSDKDVFKKIKNQIEEIINEKN